MSTIPIFNPALPFLGRIPGGFAPGLMIRIKGKINGRDKRGVVNLVNTPALHTNQDIIFHLSIRPSESAIVRNHFQDGKWGQEDRDGPYIRANETFEILILAEREVYKLAVNGQHVGVFRHRLPLHLVQFIHVSGDLNIDHILIEQDMQSNQPIAIGVSQSATSSAPIAMPVHLPIHTNNSIYSQPHPQGHPPPFFFSQDPPNQNWRY